MSPLSKTLKQIVTEETASNVCAVCQSPKRSGDSFCLRCWHRLTPAHKRQLNQYVSLDNYISNYDEAKDWLRHTREDV